MTIAELEVTLPNGFHDSNLVSVALDFCAGTCRIELDVDCDDPDPDVFRRMKLNLKGLSFFAVDPPATQTSLPFGDTVWASGYVTSEKILPGLESYRQNVPVGSFFYSFSYTIRTVTCIWRRRKLRWKKSEAAMKLASFIHAVVGLLLLTERVGLHYPRYRILTNRPNLAPRRRSARSC